MTRRKAAIALGCVVVAGCSKGYEPFAPPDPRKPLTIDEPPRLLSWLKMNDPKASPQFVRDISETVEGGAWRWTGKNPTVIVAVPKATGVKFAADITVPEITFKETGPVSIRITVNGQELTTERFDAAGARRVEKPVPDGWLKTDRDNVVAFEIDRVWTSPANGKQYGFVLTAVGFVA